MGNMKEYLKNYKQQKESQPVKKPTGKPGAPPIVKWETVKAACGHDFQFGLFDDKKDKFRDARRTKQAARDCADCRKKKQEAQEAQGRAKREAKKKARENRWNVPRLPDGATFHVSYDASSLRWSGSLFIPGCPEFSNDSSAVFKLLRKLDTQYRVWAETNGKVEKPTLTE